MGGIVELFNNGKVALIGLGNLTLRGLNIEKADGANGSSFRIKSV